MTRLVLQLVSLAASVAAALVFTGACLLSECQQLIDGGGG